MLSKSSCQILFGNHWYPKFRWKDGIKVGAKIITQLIDSPKTEGNYVANRFIIARFNRCSASDAEQKKLLNTIHLLCS